MDPTCGLVDKIRDRVFGLIWKQLLYLLHYHRNIEQLDGQLDYLNRERSSLQHRIDEATNNTNKIEENVLHWLHEVDKISEQVHQLHREGEGKLECGITSCPNLWLRCKLSKKAETIAQEAIKIYGKGNFNTISYCVPPQSMPELTNRESNKGIDSRVEIKNDIMEALRNPRFNVIGLCGLGGVGKTTIAKDIEKEEKNQKLFEKVIMVTVSQEMNIGQIQDQIIEKLGMQVNERTEELKASRLYRRLENEKNMLLILDNLWQELDLGKVGIPFFSVENYSKKNEGCKILLTSRDKALLSNLVKCQKVVEVSVLSEDEALELFKKIAELSTNSSSPELISIATEIVRKCGGLSLQIATAAKTLRNKDINEWKDALARLNNPFRRNNTLTREVDDILKWSYDRLRSSEYKKIFLLTSMLSHDPSIEDLLMYSVGFDILDGIENMEDAHVGVSAIVSKLKSLNLFLDSIYSHHVTIHDVFRDVALPIACNELHAFIRRRLKEWPDENMLRGCEGICLQESDISDFPDELYGPRLQFFLLNSKKRNLKIPDMFFKSSKDLKVLAFTNMHFSSLSSLIFLHKLKALCLHSCLLEDMAEVICLKNLKVLSLAYSEIQRLPIELAKLTSLQMLNLSHCSNLKEIPHKLLSSLKKLEVLHMENSFHQWKVEGYSEANENASLDELTDLPISSLDIHIPNISMLPENLFLDMNLKRYKISMGKHWQWQDIYETTKILKLQLESRIHLKGGVQKLLEGVEDLYLYGSNAHENVLHNHGGRGFPNLRHLQIDGNYGIRSDVFNSAHHEAATKNVSNKTFKSLFNSKVLLPKLEILKLSNLLNKLTPSIWDDQLTHNSFNNLKVLVVKSCGFVRLVPLHVLKSLNNLEELDVEDCNMLEIMFDFEDLNDYHEEMDSSSVVVPLKKLKLCNLPKLKNVWSSNCQGNVSFPCLRSIDVSYCESLTSIFPKLSLAKGMLDDLEVLQIYHCNIDVIVAKDEVSEFVVGTFGFPRLTSLILYDLPNLRNFYLHRHTLQWPHLQRLSIQNSDELEVFEKEVSSSSEIYEEESTLNSKYPLFSQDKVIHNLEELDLKGKPAEMIGTDQFPMYHFPKAKLLHLYADNATTILYRTLWKRFPNLEELKLSGHFAEAFGGDDVAALASPFPKLTLYDIRIKGSLSPLLVSSPFLTHIEVTWCIRLTTLMTSSTARSLVHLTHLSVSNCYQIEEIITQQKGENDEDKEIVFIKLKILVLYGLDRLKRFCGYNYTFRFPLLDQLVIKLCPSFKRFSPGLIDTPSLKSIQLSQDGEKQHEVWDADLNKLFYQQRLMVSREVVLDEDDATMIRNDQFPTDRFPQAEILCIERFLEEWVTFPYTLFERFPKLNELHVKNTSFEEIFPSHVPSSTSFHNLTVLKMSKCHQLVYLMTSSTVKSLMNLETLEIYDCEKLEEIIKKEPDEDVEGGITLFNGLRILKLSRLPRLKTQKDKKDFNIEDRATNIGSTNIPISLFIRNKVLLPKLERLELSYLLNNLISLIWDDQLLHNSFNNLKTLILGGCNFMKIVPLSVLKYLNNMEKLEVRSCHKLEMVFGFEDLNDYHKEMKSSSSLVVPLNLTHLEVKGCRELTTLMISSAAPSLVHITHLSITSCYQIEEIITKQKGEDDEDKDIFFNNMKFLELDNLPRLKRFCRYNYTFKFPLLDELVITRCPEFKRFSPGLIDTPCLKSVQLSQGSGERHEIWDTNLNKTFYQQRFVASREVVLDEDDAIMIKNEQFQADRCPQVEILGIEGFVDEWVTFPYTLLERFPKLNELHVKDSSFEEIFPSHSPSSTSFHNLTVLKVLLPKLERLELSYLLNDLISLIWDDQLLHNSFNNLKTLIMKRCDFMKLVPLRVLKSLNNLEKLEVSFCDKLEMVFGLEDLNDYHKEMESSSVVVPLNLTHLAVEGCHGLTTLMMSSAAPSLVHITHLSISNCNQIEEIIMKQEGEDDEDKEIFFNKIKVLELDYLPSLKRFCGYNYTFRFPLLEHVTITECPRLTIFCPGTIHAPQLQSVRVHKYESHKHIWMTDLNNTIQHLFTFEEVISTTHMMALNSKNITMITDIFPKVSSLYVESFTDEGVTFPYISPVRFPMLDWLNVEHCSFEVIFPSQDQIIDFMWKISPLKGLCIAYMDKLKTIWKDDSQLPSIHQNLRFLQVKSCCSLVKLASSSASFQNLGELYVSGCHQLIYLVTTSNAKSLVCLRWLEINDCKRMEEIVMNDTNEDVQGGITINELYRIKLTDMPSLKMFSSQSHTFEFPKLKEIEISGCLEMKMFCPGVLKTPKLSKVKIEERGMEWKDEDLNEIMEGLSSIK